MLDCEELSGTDDARDELSEVDIEAKLLDTFVDEFRDELDELDIKGKLLDAFD